MPGKGSGQPVPFWISSRMLVTFMCFICITNLMFLRQSISIGIVCMVNHTALRGQHSSLTQRQQLEINQTAPYHWNDFNSTVFGTGRVLFNALNSSTPEDQEIPVTSSSACRISSQNKTATVYKDGPLQWTKSTQSFVLGGYYWGYIILQIPAGWVVGKLGSRRIIGYCTFLASLSCLLLPIVAIQSYLGAIMLRFLTGFFSGVTTPAVHNILSNWSPAMERSTLGSFAYGGYPFGAICSFTFAGFLCRYGFAGGWASIFYVFGAGGLIFSISWLLLISETPSTHPRILPREKDYILQNLGRSRDRKVSLKVPWKAILTSAPVYGIVISAICNDFVGITFYLYIPAYLSEVMFFDISSSGLLSSLPYIFQFIVQNIGGMIVDLTIKKTSLSVGATRKIAHSIGNVICAVSLIAIGFIHCEQYFVAVALLVISVSSMGILTSGYYINPLDIAPSYAALLIAMANGIGSICGFISPILNGFITKDNPTRESWQIVFLMSAGVALCGVVSFDLLASGEIQPWAQSPVILQAEIDVPALDPPDMLAGTVKKDGIGHENLEKEESVHEILLT